jgi:hypothetical protein
MHKNTKYIFQYASFSKTDYYRTKHLNRDFRTSLHTLHVKIRQHQELNVNVK